MSALNLNPLSLRFILIAILVMVAAVLTAWGLDTGGAEASVADHTAIETVDSAQPPRALVAADQCYDYNLTAPRNPASTMSRMAAEPSLQKMPMQEYCIDIYACHIACNPAGCWRSCWYVGRWCP